MLATGIPPPPHSSCIPGQLYPRQEGLGLLFSHSKGPGPCPYHVLKVYVDTYPTGKESSGITVTLAQESPPRRHSVCRAPVAGVTGFVRTYRRRAAATPLSFLLAAPHADPTGVQ